MRARLAGGLALCFLLVPLLWPVAEAVCRAPVGVVWSERDRILDLLFTSLKLAGLTLAFCIPPGWCIGLLAFASDAPGARMARWLLLLGVAIPLPLFAVAWASVIAPMAAWSPFPDGLQSAAIVHALAAVPWVAVLIGVSVRSIDPALFDDALLFGPSGPRRLVFAVALRTLPFVATCIVVITFTEIAITDLFRVRTFAEEVFTQLTAPAASTLDSADLALARAVIACVPVPFVLAALVGGGYRFTPRWSFVNDGRVQASWRVPRIAAGVMWLGVLTPTIVPVGFLAIRAEAIQVTVAQNALRLTISVAVAVLAGVLAAAASLILAFTLKSHRLAGGILFAVAVLTLATPGPLLGLGLKQIIQRIVIAEKARGVEWLTPLLYDGPSVLPVIWAYLLRALPISLLIVAPVVGAIRREPTDATRLDTARFWRLMRQVVMPHGGYAATFAALLTCAYCLGEIGVSRLVATPGDQTAAHELFTRMHYGVRGDVAALGLALFACIAIPVALAALIPRRAGL